GPVLLSDPVAQAPGLGARPAVRAALVPARAHQRRGVPVGLGDLGDRPAADRGPGGPVPRRAAGRLAPVRVERGGGDGGPVRSGLPDLARPGRRQDGEVIGQRAITPRHPVAPALTRPGWLAAGPGVAGTSAEALR